MDDRASRRSKPKYGAVQVRFYSPVPSLPRPPDSSSSLENRERRGSRSRSPKTRFAREKLDCDAENIAGVTLAARVHTELTERSRDSNLRSANERSEIASLQRVI